MTSPDSKNSNTPESFEELRRQLGLDDAPKQKSSGFSLLEELMSDDREPSAETRDEKTLSAIERMQRELENDSDDGVTVTLSSDAPKRRIVSENVHAINTSEKQTQSASSKKQTEREQKRMEKDEEFEKKRLAHRSEKNAEKQRKIDEKIAAKKRKKGSADNLTGPAFSIADESLAANESAPIISRSGSNDGEAAFLKDVKAQALEKTIESGDDENINNISMSEYDPAGATVERKGFNKFLFNTFPNRADSGKEKLRKTVSILSILIIIGCVTYFGMLYAQRHKNISQSTALRKYVTEPAEDDPEGLTAWEKIKQEYPDVEFPLGMNVKYARLYAINPDFVGWLSIPDTKIDVQVVKAENNEKYLKLDFYGQYSRYGCPFMDFRDNLRTLSMNTIIYGHHMKDGLMFAELSKYLKPEGYEESPVISLSTLYGDYTFKIYGVFISNSKPEDDNGYVFNFIFNHLTTDEAFNSYISAVNERRLYDTGVDIQPGDKLLTLSTCTYEFDDARLVVLARLVRDGENPLSHGKTRVNENPRYPAAWYAKKNVENPYEDALRWYPS